MATTAAATVPVLGGVDSSATYQRMAMMNCVLKDPTARTLLETHDPAQMSHTELNNIYNMSLRMQQNVTMVMAGKSMAKRGLMYVTSLVQVRYPLVGAALQPENISVEVHRNELAALAHGLDSGDKPASLMWTIGQNMLREMLSHHLQAITDSLVSDEQATAIAERIFRQPRPSIAESDVTPTSHEDMMDEQPPPPPPPPPPTADGDMELMSTFAESFGGDGIESQMGSEPAPLERSTPPPPPSPSGSSTAKRARSMSGSSSRHSAKRVRSISMDDDDDDDDDGGVTPPHSSITSERAPSDMDVFGLESMI